MATLSIKNIDRCLGRLNKISDVNINESVKQATTFVHAQAKALAPVSTGALASSIHMDVKNSGKTIEGRVYTNLQYAPYVEFGTGIRGNGSYPYTLKDIKLEYKDNWQGMNAQPYMYSALKRSEKYITEMIKKFLNDNIDKSCK
ncbi:MAG: HK97 gp10 family phage protein [Bacilli bacterium]